jgi:hypothetical protein
MRAVWRWALGAEALDASNYRRTGETFLSQTLDDRLVEGLAVPGVRVNRRPSRKNPVTLTPNVPHGKS